MEKLIFVEHPEVTIATNTFVNVPVILQYEDTPLIEIVKEGAAGYTTRIPIYHSDGTYLAKTVGSRLFLTPDGEKAGLKLEHPNLMTVCKLGDRILFEITRSEAAALQTSAELYTPDGYFVKCTDSPELELFDTSALSIQVNGIRMIGNRFSNLAKGIWIMKDGSVAIGIA